VHQNNNKGFCSRSSRILEQKPLFIAVFLIFHGGHVKVVDTMPFQNHCNDKNQ